LYPGEWMWQTDAEVAHAWWSEEPTSDGLAMSETPAHDYVVELLEGGATGAVDLLQALVDAAPSEDALAHLGAGPVEDLISHYRHGQVVLAEVERHARQDPRFARAVSAVWLGRGVPPEVRRRLARWGARDLTGGPKPSA
ncbi:MAG TPA: hypothetical protein VF165_00675, partial [Nocardioidaceae bacterium]